MKSTGSPIIIAPIGDTIADAVGLALKRNNEPFRSLRELDGVSIAVDSNTEIIRLPDGSIVDATGIGNVLFRGIPSPPGIANPTDRQYAADEWSAAMSLLLKPRSKRLVINAPFPSGSRVMTTPYGRRRRLKFGAGEFVDDLDYELSNRRPPLPGETAVAHCAGRFAELDDSRSAYSGRELFTIFKASVIEVVYVWIVGGATVASGHLGATLGQRPADKAALDLAQMVTSRAGHMFGITWILRVDCEVNPFMYWDFDPFPSSELAQGDEHVIGQALARLLVS